MSSVNNTQTPLSSPPSAIAAAFAGLLALALAMGIGRFAFTPVLPMMLEDAGLSLAGGSLLASANYVGYLLGALLALVVRVRPVAGIRGGLVVICVTTLAMGLHLPLAAWMLMRMLAGIGSAWVLISVSAWCLDTLSRHRRPALNSIVFAGVGAGIAIAGLLCILLVRMHAGSPAAWFALGLFSCIVTAAIWRVFRSDEAEAAAGAARPAGMGAFRWDGESIRLVACYGVFGFGYIIPATYLPVMARRALDDPALFGWAWPVFGAAAALSTLAVALAVRRFGNRRLWIAGHLIMAAGVALPAMRPDASAVFLAALLVGGTFMVVTLCAMQEARQVAGHAATVLIAAMTSAFAAGQILGPLSVAYLAGGDDGFRAALLAAALLLVASAFALSRKSAMRHLIEPLKKH